AEAYEAAVKCYPNSAFLRAQLAAVYDELGRTDQARTAADEAARLDALCPHEEQKLEKRMLYDPQWPLETAPPTAEKLANENAAKVVARLRSGSADDSTATRSGEPNAPRSPAEPAAKKSTVEEK